MTNGMMAAALLCATGAMAFADWPQWRGPERDGHAAADEKINPEKINSPQRVWRIPVGGGFSSPIVVKDKVIYTDEDGAREVAHCVDAATGKEIWKTDYADVFGDEWGKGPRATAFSDGERVYVQSCNGEFRCLDINDGKILWGFSFEDYGVKFLGSKAREGTASRRGNNGSGILEGDTVIVPVGSREGATLVCLDKKDGTLLWKSGQDEAAYSSLVTGGIAGARQVLAFAADALVGFDCVTGRQLWRMPLVTNAKRHTMTPLVQGNRVFVNSHTFGTICFEVSQRAGEFQIEEKWRNKEAKINLATPVLVDGHLYSHGAKKDFVCLDAATGEERWSQPGFGTQISSVLAAGERLFVLSDNGEGILLKANPERYEELARSQMGAKNWNHPAMADGKIYIRDGRELSCYIAE